MSLKEKIEEVMEVVCARCNRNHSRHEEHCVACGQKLPQARRSRSEAFSPPGDLGYV